MVRDHGGELKRSFNRQFTANELRDTLSISLKIRDLPSYATLGFQRQVLCRWDGMRSICGSCSPCRGKFAFEASSCFSKQIASSSRFRCRHPDQKPLTTEHGLRVSAPGEKEVLARGN
jgi:hypothetical protein